MTSPDPLHRRAARTSDTSLDARRAGLDDEQDQEIVDLLAYLEHFEAASEHRWLVPGDRPGIP